MQWFERNILSEFRQSDENQPILPNELAFYVRIKWDSGR
jgi:hypothetical protein